MDINAIREALGTRPFVPFCLRLADGRDLFVPHPDFVAVSPNERQVAVFDSTRDLMHVLEPLLVVTLEKAVPPAGTFPTPPAPPTSDADGPGASSRP